MSVISRQAAIDAECEVCQIAPKKERGHNCTYYVHGCKEIECLRALPSAQPERKKGKWRKIDHSWFHDDYQCSVCGNSLDFNGVNAGRGDARFCPNCGADMRGEEDEVDRRG